MQVYLLRHGIAEEGTAGVDDADRALTQEGRRKLRQIIAAVADADVAPSLIVSSPLKRAVQTAEIASDVLKYKNQILRTKALLPGASVEQVWQELRVHRDEASVMLVGHNPLFSELPGYLLGYREVQIDFKKGAILRLDLEHFPPQPRGILRWFLTAKLATNCD